MAANNINESNPRAATYEYVIGGFEERRDQLHAIANSLLHRLEPKDPKNPEDECDVTAWRLAQVIYDMLSCASLETASRDMLMNGMKSAA